MSKWSDNEIAMQQAVREEIISALWRKIVRSVATDFSEIKQFQILKQVVGLAVEKDKQVIQTAEGLQFDQAIQDGNYEQFKTLLWHAITHSVQPKPPALPLGVEEIESKADKILAEIQNGEHLSLPMVDNGNPHITLDDIQDLREYMQEKNIVADVVITHHGQTFSVGHDALGTDPVLAIHSVAKVFTGILLMKYLHEGVSKGTDADEPLIKETDLDKPIDLDPSVLAQLSPEVQDHLKGVTLRQVMLHQSGLGDYFDNEEGVSAAIAKQLDQQLPPPHITSSLELLKYGDNNVEAIGQRRYSNFGMLLLGFAIEKKYQDAQRARREVPLLTIDQLMQRFAKDEVGMNIFESKRPINGQYNATEQRNAQREILADKTPEYIKEYVSARFASTAGGYWTTNADLQKFAQWIQAKCANEPNFKRLIETHGEEFYSAGKQAVEHSGLHADTAHFYTSLRNGTTITILSPQGERAATNLADTILKQTTWYKMQHSAQHSVSSQPVSSSSSQEPARVLSPAYDRAVSAAQSSSSSSQPTLTVRKEQIKPNR